MRTNAEMRNLAEMILCQIGGSRFLENTGSTMPTVTEKGLSLRLAENKLNANGLDIIYDEKNDAYIMKFYRRTEQKKDFLTEVTDKTVVVYYNVYGYELTSFFEYVTGVHTGLIGGIK